MSETQLYVECLLSTVPSKMVPFIKSELSKSKSGLASMLPSGSIKSDNSVGRQHEEPAATTDLIANDDYPSFPGFWQAGAKEQGRNFKLAMATGTIIGLVIACVFYAGSVAFGG